MARKSKPQQAADTQAAATKLFLRRIHGQRHLKRGISSARAATRPRFIPEIVRQLMHNSLYRSHMTNNAFPSELSHFGNHLRLANISLEGEFAWAASVLSHFSKQLSSFATLREAYFDSFLYGKLNDAEELLDRVTVEFGHSIWTIDQRLKLLQAKGGLKAQKDYLDQVISTKDINFFAAYMAFFFSLRIEGAGSIEELRLQLDEIKRTNTAPIVDYVRSHIFSFEQALISDESVPINFDEIHPIIDRYETFIRMAFLGLARPTEDTNTKDTIERAVRELDGISDPRLDNLRRFFGADIADNRRTAIQAYDLYTVGEYRAALEESGRNLELSARCHIMLATPSEQLPKASIRDEIVALMHDVLLASATSQQSVERLRKLTLMCSGHDFEMQIFDFNERSADHLIDDRRSKTQILAALYSSSTNPMNAAVTDRILNSDLLRYFGHGEAVGPTVALQKALREGDLNLIQKIGKLPRHRRLMYEGHVYFGLKKFNEAARCYEAVAHEANEYASALGTRHLYSALFHGGQYRQALAMIVPYLLSNGSRLPSYPVGELASRCVGDDSLMDTYDLSILLHMSSRSGEMDRERELSDAYESVISRNGGVMPSSLPDVPGEQGLAKLVYFLRYVAVPRILSDTTQFDDVDEVEGERMAICQRLLLLDPKNSNAYQAEIRTLTRDAEVSRLLFKLQASLIYVDETGLRQHLESSVDPSLQKLKALMAAPDVAYQAEKVSKRLEQLMTLASGGGDFKGMSLPATEVEGLWRAIYFNVLSEFAINPAYGLDTHVSTSIRHGVFEGEIRSPLAVEELLLTRPTKGSWNPSTLVARMPWLLPAEAAHVAKQLERFTERFEELLQLYLREKLHVNVIGGSPHALFSFDAKTIDPPDLKTYVSSETGYDSVMDKLLTLCWVAVDRSLTKIREDLNSFLMHQMNLAFDSLIRGIEHRVSHAKVTVLSDAVARARLAFQVAISNVANWFQLPNDLAREPFDFEVAAHIALRQINNCFVATPLAVSMDIQVVDRPDGSLLDGTCEILFILLQNVLLRSGLPSDQTAARLSVRKDGCDLLIEVNNALAADRDLDDLRAQAMESVARYQRDTALKTVRHEGGSGLSKIWRICEFELKVRSTLKLTVGDDCTFCATVILHSLGNVPC